MWAEKIAVHPGWSHDIIRSTSLAPLVIPAGGVDAIRGNLVQGRNDSCAITTETFYNPDTKSEPNLL